MGRLKSAWLQGRVYLGLGVIYNNEVAKKVSMCCEKEAQKSANISVKVDCIEFFPRHFTP